MCELMILVLIVVIGLVAWSLHLMQEATTYREFSLMLAGTLVALSAAGLMVVYFLMNGYMGYMTSDLHQACALQSASQGLVEFDPQVHYGLAALEAPTLETKAPQHTF
jgi:amino acid transporter